MSLTRERNRDDRQLIRYLVGLLPEAEAERIDERSVVDDEFVARLRAVEDELVDGYVSGTLRGEILERFESHYLASPRRRERVRSAGRFLGAVGRSPEPAAAPVKAVRPLVWLPAAAALLMVLCGVLLVRDLQLRRSLDGARRDGRVLDERVAQLTEQLGDQRAAYGGLAGELERLRAARPGPPTAVVLLPETRAAVAPTIVAVPAGGDALPLDLRLDTGGFQSYRVALHDPATARVVWRADGLTPAATRRLPTLSIAVPATTLKPQHYVLVLAGRRANGAFETVGSYGFQIERR